MFAWSSPPLPQHPQAAPTFPPQLQQAVSANTKPSPPLPPGKRPRHSSPRRLQEDFNLFSEDESSSPATEDSNPPPESFREATPLPTSPTPTLNISPLKQRVALREQDGSEEAIEADVDIEVEEPKSQDWALQVEEEEKDLLKESDMEVEV